MKTFTIDNETNNVNMHTTIQDSEAMTNAERFRNESGLARLAANWPASRLVDIWNRLPGAIPIKKFKDRATAVNRIWKAIQSLGHATPDAADELAPISEPAPAFDLTREAEPEPAITESLEPVVAAPAAPATADVGPEEPAAKIKATRAKKSSVATKKTAHKGSKTDTILGLMKQPGGTTLNAIIEATNWQAHSVRGFISGTLRKKMGLAVVSARGENGDRSYSINS